MPRLEKLIARNLGCSRREAIALIAKASKHGAALPEAIATADLPLTVTLADRPLVLRDSFHLLLNKPKGCVTALSDARHETALAFLTSAPLLGELRPVGRLDLDTTGLLLWTTDGTWLHRLTHPRSCIERTYQAALARPFSPLGPGLALRDGHRPNITELRELADSDVHPSLERPAESACFAQISITGGAYHEVRRIFAALGSHVLALCRVRFGGFALPTDLPPGAWREIQQEIRA
ncbi:MAG TPA: pseudouridine synthase [Polyangia bacterium]